MVIQSWLLFSLCVLFCVGFLFLQVVLGALFLLSNYLTDVLYLNRAVAVFCVSSSRCSILQSVIVPFPGYTHIL